MIKKVHHIGIAVNNLQESVAIFEKMLGIKAHIEGAPCQKVSEAEAMVDGGVPDVLIANEVVGAPKLKRLAALAKRARIAVCGLNPHAGEGGQMGDEEQTIIGPAVLAAQRRQLDVVGPLSGDTVFHHALHGDYDVVVAMYHDQGLAPLKAVAFTVPFTSSSSVGVGVPMMVANAVKQIWFHAFEKLGPDSDFSEIVKIPEGWAGVEVKGK